MQDCFALGGVVKLQGSYIAASSSLKLHQQVRCMQLFTGNPFIIGGGVSFPSHKVLLLLPLPKVSFLDDLINFPFWLTFYDLWWWFQEVGSVLFGFLV